MKNTFMQQALETALESLDKLNGLYATDIRRKEHFLIDVSEVIYLVEKGLQEARS